MIGESMTWCDGKNGELGVLRHASIDSIGWLELPVDGRTQEFEGVMASFAETTPEIDHPDHVGTSRSLILLTVYRPDSRGPTD